MNDAVDVIHTGWRAEEVFHQPLNMHEIINTTPNRMEETSVLMEPADGGNSCL